jgi:hypothetical protein
MLFTGGGHSSGGGGGGYGKNRIKLIIYNNQHKSNQNQLIIKLECFF